VHYRRRVVQALIGLALGVGMVVAGIVLPLVGLAAGGFVVLLLSGIWALNSWRQMATTALGVPKRSPEGSRRRRRRAKRGNAARSSMMERLDERWRRRQEGGL
jgi:hypothetical protein